MLLPLANEPLNLKSESFVNFPADGVDSRHRGINASATSHPGDNLTKLFFFVTLAG
jgi:hypothetical protein